MHFKYFVTKISMSSFNIEHQAVNMARVYRYSNEILWADESILNESILNPWLLCQGLV